MYKNLRILFCILAVICATVTVFIFVFFELWGLVPLGGGVIFAGLMFLCKRAQEAEELKRNPPPPAGDFITGRVPINNAKNETDGNKESSGGEADNNKQ